MKKLSEKRYLGLTLRYLESKSKRQTAIREALKEWLAKNNNVVNVPENYLTNEETLSQYALAFAEEDQYVIAAVMNLYFNKPPMFNVS